MKFFRDTWLIFSHSMTITLRNPVWVFVGLFQPVCFLLLFGPLLNGVDKVPGFPPGGAFNVFTPGLLIQLGLFSAAFVGFGLIADLRAGFIEQMRVTPVNRLALLLGRALRDVLNLIVQAIVLLLVAWPMGLQANLGGIVLTLLLLALIGLLAASCSYALALALRSEDALAPMLNTFTLPLLLLSGITLPLSLAPDWIRGIATFNPLAHAVDAARALFNGDFGNSTVLLGFVIIGILAALAAWWAARAFRQATA